LVHKAPFLNPSLLLLIYFSFDCVTSSRAKSLIKSYKIIMLRIVIAPVVIYSTPRPTDSPSSSGEAVSVDLKREMRIPLETESSSGQQESLDLNPPSLDLEDRSVGCFSASQQEGNKKTSIESVVCCRDFREHVLPHDVSPEKRIIGQSKMSISRTNGTNRASSTETTQPQNILNFKETERKCFFTEFGRKNLPTNDNLLEYFRLPIPSKLHLRSHIAAKSKEMSRASISNAKRTS
jgi:hypothetical protein